MVVVIQTATTVTVPSSREIPITTMQMAIIVMANITAGIILPLVTGVMEFSILAIRIQITIIIILTVITATASFIAVITLRLVTGVTEYFIQAIQTIITIIPMDITAMEYFTVATIL